MILASCFGSCGNLIAEADGGTGAVTAEYVALEGKPLAYIATGAICWVHGDHPGTPQVLTDGAAAVVWDASYRPFGEASIAGAAANAQRFPGQTADAETGYHDNWHRTYDPSLGRYLQSDPIGLGGGWNTYGYVGGNPVMYADPEGLRFFGPGALVGAVAVAVGVVANNMGRAAGGFAVGAAFDLGMQMWMNNGNIRCVSWTSVFISGGLGAAGAVGFNAAMAGGLKWAFGFKNGSRLNSAFPRGIEYLERSRFWPGRWGGPHSWWNQNLVPGTIHALTDPKRWQFMKSAFKKEWTNVYNFMNKTSFGAVLSSLAFRVPWWFEGAVAGGATGATATSTKCECE